MIAELVGGKLDGTLWEIPEFKPHLYFAEPPKGTRVVSFNEGIPEEALSYKTITYVAHKRISDDKVLYRLEGP
jgi:hypothetical protein